MRVSKSESYQRLHAIIRGRVQGVFFRAWTRETGQRLQLNGWVRNNPDGTVETMAEGSRETLEEFLRRCWQGPPAAQVKDIQVKWAIAKGEYDGFKITY
jgi:acylphosphatase